MLSLVNYALFTHYSRTIDGRFTHNNRTITAQFLSLEADSQSLQSKCPLNCDKVAIIFVLQFASDKNTFFII